MASPGKHDSSHQLRSTGAAGSVQVCSPDWYSQGPERPGLSMCFAKRWDRLCRGEDFRGFKWTNQIFFPQSHTTLFSCGCLNTQCSNDWKMLGLMPEVPRTWKWTTGSSLLSGWLEHVYNQAGKIATLWEHLRLQHPLQTQAQHNLLHSL